MFPLFLFVVFIDVFEWSLEGGAFCFALIIPHQMSRFVSIFCLICFACLIFCFRSRKLHAIHPPMVSSLFLTISLEFSIKMSLTCSDHVRQNDPDVWFLLLFYLVGLFSFFLFDLMWKDFCFQQYDTTKIWMRCSFFVR